MVMEPKSVTALIGPSGCGKSTFLRSINRMHEVLPGARVEGKLTIDDQDVYGRDVDVTAVRRLIGMVFLSLTQRRPEQTDVGFPLLATLLFGAGLGDAAELSPFLVCALATALIVNVSPRRHAVRRVLADWERPIYAIFLVIAGALLTLPTVWILVAVPLLAAARAAAKWAVVRYGVALRLAGASPDVGLGTLAQGGAVIGHRRQGVLEPGARRG